MYGEKDLVYYKGLFFIESIMRHHEKIGQNQRGRKMVIRFSFHRRFLLKFFLCCHSLLSYFISATKSDKLTLKCLQILSTSENLISSRPRSMREI